MVRPKSYDLKKEALALDKWSKTDDATALCQFCVARDIHAQRLYEWRDQSTEFAEVLSKARMRLSNNMRKKLESNQISYGLFMRELGAHDAFTHNYEDSLKVREYELKKLLVKYEYELKSAATQQVTDELKDAHSAVMSQLKELQDARKAAKSKGKSVDKS